MRLSDAIKERRPAPPQPVDGVREIAFRPAGNYTRTDARQIVDQLRNGLPGASETVDELGIGLCGLLEGGRYAHCAAERCYPSVQAMRVKAFSNVHGQRVEPNPFPPGSLSLVNNPDEEWDGAERSNARLAFAVQAAEAARAQFEATDPAARAAALERAEYEKAAALRELAASFQNVDAQELAAARQEITNIKAGLGQG